MQNMVSVKHCLKKTLRATCASSVLPRDLSYIGNGVDRIDEKKGTFLDFL